MPPLAVPALVATGAILGVVPELLLKRAHPERALVAEWPGLASDLAEARRISRSARPALRRASALERAVEELLCAQLEAPLDGAFPAGSVAARPETLRARHAVGRSLIWGNVAAAVASAASPRAVELCDSIDNDCNGIIDDGVEGDGDACVEGFDVAPFELIRARFSATHRNRSGADDAYAILGLSRHASDDEVRKTYRQLVREHHPDRLVAKGLPAEFVAHANRTLADINVAYDRIAKERKLR